MVLCQMFKFWLTAAENATVLLVVIWISDSACYWKALTVIQIMASQDIENMNVYES